MATSNSFKEQRRVVEAQLQALEAEQQQRTQRLLELERQLQREDLQTALAEEKRLEGERVLHRQAISLHDRLAADREMGADLARLSQELTGKLAQQKNLRMGGGGHYSL